MNESVGLIRCIQKVFKGLEGKVTCIFMPPLVVVMTSTPPMLNVKLGHIALGFVSFFG